MVNVGCSVPTMEIIKGLRCMLSRRSSINYFHRNRNYSVSSTVHLCKRSHVFSILGWNQFSSFLESLISSPAKLLITGDFNFHVDQWLVWPSRSEVPWSTDLLSFNLHQHIKDLTHKKTHTLDRIITRSNENTASNFSVYDPVISDHMVVHCNLHVNKSSCPKTITYRNLRSINIDDFRHDIVNSD